MGAQHLAIQQKRKKWLEQGCKFDLKRKLWVGPNNWPLLPVCIYHILQYVQYLNHWITDKNGFMGKTKLLEAISKYSYLGIWKNTKSA